MLRKSTALRNMLLGKRYNKIVNGSFDNDTSGWSANAITTISIDPNGVEGNCLKAANGSDVTQSIGVYQTVAVTPYKPYGLECYINAANVSSQGVWCTVSFGESLSQQSSIFYNPGWNKVTMAFLPLSSSVTVHFVTSAEDPGKYFLIDFVKLYPIDGSIKNIFSGGKIRIYSGAQPASADDAPTGNLLVEINPDDGLQFEEPVDGVLSKKSDQNWTANALAEGTAGWFRLMTAEDDGSSSTEFPRIDGSIATSGAELNMTNTYIASGSTQTISDFNISISE